MTPLHRMLGTLCLSCLASNASSVSVHPLDDAASPRPQIEAIRVLNEQGRPLQDTLNPRVAVVHFGQVDYRLSTAAYLGRMVRIVYVIPPLVPGLRSASALRVDWRGMGRFASGSARPGDRVVVWAGKVQEPLMAEALDVTWRIEMAQVEPGAMGRLSVQAYFEVEVVQ